MNYKKIFIKNVYSKYWFKKSKEYIHNNINNTVSIKFLDEVCKTNKLKDLLEVCIGTGAPIANEMQKKGYHVSGIDYSPELIEECKRVNKNINAKVGDAEKLEYGDQTFDLVYCFNSTWCLSDILSTISEMYRVTKDNGIIIFDILNDDNPKIKKIFKDTKFENENIIGMIYKTIKNLVKLILNKGYPQWEFIVLWNFTNYSYIKNFTNKINKQKIAAYYLDENTCSLIKVTKNFEYHERLFFKLKKIS